MKKNVLMLILCGLVSLSYAEAPVVDNSEEFKAIQLAQSEDKHYPYNLDDAKNRDVKMADNAYDAEPQSEEERMQILLSKIDAMQREMASLRGQVEVQSHQLTQLAQARGGQQVTRNSPQVVSKSNELASPKTQEQAAQIVPKLAKAHDPVEEQLSYVGAFELVKSRRYDKAIPAMQDFLGNYPKGPYAANAHYWLGELLLLKKDLSGAVKEFKTVVDDFSDSNKLAAAKFKLGVTYIRLGENDKARVELKHVAEQFPNTSAARLAKAKLDDL